MPSTKKLAALRRKWTALKAYILCCRMLFVGTGVRSFPYYVCARKFRQGKFPDSPARPTSGNYLTWTPNHCAGIGHQAAGWMSAWGFAKALGLTFVHRPFSEPWDDFLGFGAGELHPKIVRKLIAKSRTLPRLPGEIPADLNHPFAHMVAHYSPKGKTLFRCEFDQAQENLNLVAEDVSQKFFSRHPELQRQGPFLTVVAHIRRGDAMVQPPPSSDLKHSRFLPEEYYANLIHSLQSFAGDLPVRFEICSDGSPHEFPILSKIPFVTFRLGESATQSFTRLATADILIVGRSGFSFLAGMVNRGIKIATVPWWHSIPESWQQIDLENWSDGILPASCNVVNILNTNRN